MEKRALPMLNHVLQHTLRSLCSETQWVYTVFWRILPRNYPPPKWEGAEGGAPPDRSKGNKRNWILVWEDGYCDFASCSGRGRDRDARMARYGCRQHHPTPSADVEECAEMMMSPELFFKMSHEVYNYGEGLMGKVAADNSHKWVYREPMEHEISFLSPWHGSLDPHPQTWEAQFKAGIQTIAVISVREGLIQLGSTQKVFEDLNFVIFMQRKFNYLQSIPGVFVPHPSSSPLTGVSGRNGGNIIGDTSPPADDSFVWPASTSHNPAYASYSSGPVLGPDPDRLNATQKRFKSDILGIKRQQLLDGSPGSAGLDDPFLSSGRDLDVGGGCQSDCPQSSPPPSKSLGDGSSPVPGPSDSVLSLLPSMSSLHNLLSKLPSVTPPPDSPGSDIPRLGWPPDSPGGSDIMGGPYPSQSRIWSSHSIPRPQVEQRPSGNDHPSGVAAADGMPSSGLGQQQHQLHVGGRLIDTASSVPNTSECPQEQREAERDEGHANDPGTSRYSGSAVQQPLLGGRLDTNFHSPVASPHRVHHTSSLPGQQQEQQQQQHYHPGASTPGRHHTGATADDLDKRTLFLDSFVQDSMTDLEFHQALENSDTYHSLLGEIMH